ncbi:hypothetical protein IV38_GL001028 [Lactobacillus selangorensis]|uniref:Uncharacterized protein n=1 Tax=Lactobacillus selangorensis TaxID=81857 RepID=A0A0R2FX41_9LACO|nr:hypothetical protein [Lactobacillus selangorensis]KRN28822.1 hypothetical protein IV38_GL001028 [Lactobacillus selangorensis]KRN32768.1 hypothetical protein IV40_GL000826 [Lactobacillus selangorensis]
MKKGNKTIWIIIGAVLLVLVVGVVVVRQQVTTQNELADNINKAVENKDGALFLKQFDQNSQEIKFASVGAQSVVEQWHDHASLPSDQIGTYVAEGRSVEGTDVTYKFYVGTKKVFGMDSYYLEARPTSVTFPYADLNQATVKLTNGGKRRSITADQFKQGLFPGKYNFEVSNYDDIYDGNYYVNLSGSGASYEDDLD